MCAAGDFEKGDPGQRVVVAGAALAGNGYDGLAPVGHLYCGRVGWLAV